MPRYFELVDVSDGRKYYYRYLDGKTPRIKFNVTHPGTYLSEQPFEVTNETSIRTPYNLPELPTPNRNRYQDTELILDDSIGTLAGIYSRNGRIHVSEEFLTLPKQVQGFLLFHEDGHMLYSEEEDCDLYALVCSLRIGYNRSMCLYALTDYLSDTKENRERVNKLFSKIQTTQTQKL